MKKLLTRKLASISKKQWLCWILGTFRGLLHIVIGIVVSSIIMYGIKDVFLMIKAGKIDLQREFIISFLYILMGFIVHSILMHKRLIDMIELLSLTSAYAIAFVVIWHGLFDTGAARVETSIFLVLCILMLIVKHCHKQLREEIGYPERYAEKEIDIKDLIRNNERD
ncbi:hypothetical protein [Breznakia pachnodae]|uniref:Uncharacterized membrane protein YhaH (DUF805 family) n=1 Tax=Breznakia pachnodae TaxID=265178 RepID=A0ABU0E6Y8_9FIRM|nr:hypothetical protein [Breznakia pachnodae]MDQ0362468.1 uncharacterized membrane protein YhaH (DUF805 family) [Breznakia pachnodae]